MESKKTPRHILLNPDESTTRPPYLLNDFIFFNLETAEA